MKKFKIFPIAAAFLFSGISPCTANALSHGQENIVSRADYVYDSKWICQTTVKGWRDKSSYIKGKEYHIPYGQPESTGKYICWDISVADFLDAVENPEDDFYFERSSDSGTKFSVFYALDCSGLVSYCWGLPVRTVTADWDKLPAEDLGKCTSANVYKIETGDALNHYEGENGHNHVVVVSDVVYDAKGKITKFEITEQTVPETKRSYYTPSQLVSKYSTYIIYRYDYRDNVLPASDGRPTTEMHKGDVDGNGEINSHDALEVLEAVVNGTEFVDELQQFMADADNDGEITPNDALEILHKVVGM